MTSARRSSGLVKLRGRRGRLGELGLDAQVGRIAVTSSNNEPLFRYAQLLVQMEDAIIRTSAEAAEAARLVIDQMTGTLRITTLAKHHIKQLQTHLNQKCFHHQLSYD